MPDKRNFDKWVSSKKIDLPIFADMNSNNPEATLDQLEPEQLICFLQQFPSYNRYIVAVSGGKDSMALAHLFYVIKHRIKQTIEMVYVNHGLQAESLEWDDYCRKQAKNYEFIYQTLTITDSPESGESIEEWARNGRYEKLSTLVDEYTLIFTAHHQNDQVETLLLRLFRGAGTRGMRCMQVARKLGNGLLVRPLINISRKQIEDYIRVNNLSWVEDQSNEDTTYDRNYLRQEVIPVIEKRWPSFRTTIARTINNQQEAGDLLDAMAETDLNSMSDAAHLSINIDKLKVLSKARAKNVLMYWVRERQYAAPSHQHLAEILNNTTNTNNEKLPIVNWGDVELKKYRNRLYLLKTNQFEVPSDEYQINFDEPISINNEELKWKITEGEGIAIHYQHNKRFTLQFRQGGEKIRLAKKGISKTIKQLFQENGVLPWKREIFPLVYIDDQLAAVPGICVDEHFSANDNESGIVFYWTGFDQAIIQHE